MSAQRNTAEPTIVNGINVDDLFALIDNVKRDPAKGKTNWHVTTTWQGQARSRAEIESYGIGGKQVARRFTFDIDEPCELGGSNSFANPQGHRRSWSGCLNSAISGSGKLAINYWQRFYRAPVLATRTLL